MTGRRHLAAVPGRREQQVLDWLAEPEPVDASRPLDLAFAALGTVRQLPPRPWTRLADQVRPEPFGTPFARAIGLVVAAALVLGALAATWLTVGEQPQRRPIVAPPGPSSSLATDAPPSGASSLGPLPLAAPGYQVILGDGDRIYMIRTDGGGRLQVASELTGRLIAPQWAPNGRHALALEQTTSSEQLWDIDTVGDRRPLVIIPCVAPCQSRNEASWSRDGTAIVLFQAVGKVVNGIPATCGIARYDMATQVITSITSSPCGVVEERHARFSPDDSKLAFWRSRSPGRVPIQEIEDSAIFTRDLATGRETQVTDWSIHASELDWSPDGRWIAFIPDYWNQAAEEADVWRIHPDGSGLERMTNLDSATVRIASPRYSSDGKWLLFIRVTRGATTSGELLAIPANGGAPVSVLPGTSVLDFDIHAPAG